MFGVRNIIKQLECRTGTWRDEITHRDKIQSSNI